MIDLQPLPRVGVGEGEAAFCRRSSSDIPDDIQQDAVPELALRVAVTLNGGRARPNLIATKTAPTGNQNFVGGVPSASSQGCLHGATLVGLYSLSLAAAKPDDALTSLDKLHHLRQAIEPRRKTRR